MHYLQLLDLDTNIATHVGYRRFAKMRKLLEDCLRKLKSEFESAEYKSDREFFGEKFQSHRASYLRLFSGGATELAAAGIPASLD